MTPKEKIQTELEKESYLYKPVGKWGGGKEILLCDAIEISNKILHESLAEKDTEISILLSADSQRRLLSTEVESLKKQLVEKDKEWLAEWNKKDKIDTEIIQELQNRLRKIPEWLQEQREICATFILLESMIPAATQKRLVNAVRNAPKPELKW